MEATATLAEPVAPVEHGHLDDHPPEPILAAENEGMPPVEPPDAPPFAPEPSPEPDPPARPYLTAALEELLIRQAEIADELDEANVKLEKLTTQRKEASALVDSLHDSLAANARRIKALRTADEPDPGRYPLLDKPAPVDPAKAEINEAFAPSDDFASAWLKHIANLPIHDLGLTIAVSAILAEAGIATVGQYVERSNAASDPGAFQRSIKGLTPKRYEVIGEAIASLLTQFEGVFDARAAAAPDADDLGEVTVTEDDGEID